MSENDFSAAYPPEVPKGRESERPAADMQQDGSTVAVPPAPTAPTAPTAPEAGSRRIEAPRVPHGRGPGTATHPTREAGTHASGVLDELGRGMHENAAVGQRRAAANLRRIGDDLAWMVKDQPPGGTASALVEQAAWASESLADWLDEREPRDLLTAGQQFARRRPVAFLGIAVGAGVLLGRLAGHVAADASATTDTARTVPGQPVNPLRQEHREP